MTLQFEQESISPAMRCIPTMLEADPLIVCVRYLLPYESVMFNVVASLEEEMIELGADDEEK